MKKSTLILTLILAGLTVDAQNLVTNGDFEQFATCPASTGQLTNATSWINLSSGGVTQAGTPDYYNQCGAFNVDVPDNVFGNQPAQSGVAYAGIYLSQLSGNVREYLEVPLTAPLVAGTCYHFEMYVNLGDYCQYSTDAIGVFIAHSAITNVNTYYPLPLNPHISNTAGNYFNSATWSVVSANYTANGGENHLILGNFKEDQNTTTVLVNPSGFTAMAYCYVDNVSLIQIPPCTTGITDEGEDDNVMVYPNPILDVLNIAINSNENAEIILYDITYKKIIQQVFNGFVSLNIQELSKGSYFYEVRSKAGLIAKGKIIK